MKKLLLQLLFLLTATITFAQKNQAPPLLQEFDKKVLQITSSFKLDEHVRVFQFNLDNENFDLIAVDDAMNVKWKSTFKGYSLGAGRFKNKILAVAASDYSYFKGIGNNYQGLIIDPATGKTLFDKIIYTSTSGHMEHPKLMFEEDGDFFTLAVHETGIENKMLTKAENEEAQINNIVITTYNEKLEPQFTFKLTIAKGLFADITANGQNDIFIASFDKTNSVVVATKYNAGSKEPVTTLEQEISVKDNSQFKTPGDVIHIFASVSNPNALYVGALYTTPEKEEQLGLIKYDFVSKIKKFTSETFNKDHLKSLEKGYERINKDIDKPDLGNSKNLDLRYIDEYAGKVIVTVSGRYIYRGTNTAWSSEYATLINAYDLDLSLKFQQLLPAQNSYIGKYLPVDYHFDKNHLRVLATYQTSAVSLKGMYADLDLETGKWIKQELLSKKKLDNGDYIEGSHAMWNATNYIVPYMSRAGMFTLKYDVILQQNDY